LKPTIRGIADAVGVSPATVSRSLNNSPLVSSAIRARVVAEAARRGYEVPRRANRTGRVGLLFLNESSGPRFGGYDAVVWAGVTRAAMSLQYEVCVIDPRDRKPDETFSTFANRKGVEGLIVRVDDETRHLSSAIARDGVPHVVIADRFDDPKVNYVCCNSLAPSRAAVEHLLHLGHRRIAVCHNTILDTDHCDRIRGYREALQAAGITPSPDWVIAVAAEIGGGAAALNRLLSLPEPPTAAFFTDPALTIGALRRALEVGIRVPEEFSVIGVDDERLRKMTHPIFTAVCQNAADLANQAGRWLCRHLQMGYGGNGESASCRLEVEAFLEINQTTAPPPAHVVRVTPTGERLAPASSGDREAAEE